MEEKKPTENYKDEKQSSIDSLKNDAERVKEKYSYDSPKTIQIINAIVGALVAGAICFVWVLVMLLIISFVSLSYIHMGFESMLVVSIIVGCVAVLLFGFFRLKKVLK